MNTRELIYGIFLTILLMPLVLWLGIAILIDSENYLRLVRAGFLLLGLCLIATSALRWRAGTMTRGVMLGLFLILIGLATFIDIGAIQEGWTSNSAESVGDALHQEASVSEVSGLWSSVGEALACPLFLGARASFGQLLMVSFVLINFVGFVCYLNEYDKSSVVTRVVLGNIALLIFIPMLAMWSRGNL